VCSETHGEDGAADQRQQVKEAYGAPRANAGSK
jgi:hypothetical protein